MQGERRQQNEYTNACSRHCVICGDYIRTSCPAVSDFFRRKENAGLAAEAGGMLPSAIMAVLIIYCLKDVPDDFTGVGIQKLLAVLVVVISYHFKRSTFLSIFLGTAAYMLLLHFI